MGGEWGGKKKGIGFDSLQPTSPIPMRATVVRSEQPIKIRDL